MGQPNTLSVPVAYLPVPSYMIILPMSVLNSFRIHYKFCIGGLFDTIS